MGILLMPGNMLWEASEDVGIRALLLGAINRKLDLLLDSIYISIIKCAEQHAVPVKWERGLEQYSWCFTEARKNATTYKKNCQSLAIAAGHFDRHHCAGIGRLRNADQPAACDFSSSVG